MIITFSAAGDPRGQGRPRTRVVKREFATIYKDPVDRAYEDSIRELAKEAMGDLAPFEGPVSLSLRFRLAVPKSYSKRVRAAMLAGEQAYLGAFDVSNMVKSTEDAMNKVVWLDDKQVVRLFATKVAHVSPGLDVRVETFDG